MKLNYGQLIGPFFLFWAFVILNYFWCPSRILEEFVSNPDSGTIGFWPFVLSFLCFCLDGGLLVWCMIKVSSMGFWKKEINLDKIKNKE